MFRSASSYVLILVVGFALTVTGCQNIAQTGGLAGAGIGALAGQAIGHNTESTLIGAAVGGGIGYIIGNEKDKQKAKEMTAADTTPPANHTEVGTLGGTRWKVVSLNPQNIVPAYASMIVEFRKDGRAITTTTNVDGKVVVTDESYRVVGTTLILNTPGYLVNGRFQITGNQLVVSADKFSAVLEKISA